MFIYQQFIYKKNPATLSKQWVTILSITISKLSCEARFILSEEFITQT